MTIEARLNEDLKNHMRAKNADTVACIRQLKSKVQEAVNAKDFRGPTDDAFYQGIIASYIKSLQKAITEMESAGARSQVLRDKYAAEITYLTQYMPTLLDEAATRDLVNKTITALGINDVKQAGKVIGALMKDHKSELDPALARRLVGEALGSGT